MPKPTGFVHPISVTTTKASRSTKRPEGYRMAKRKKPAASPGPFRKAPTSGKVDRVQGKKTKAKAPPIEIKVILRQRVDAMLKDVHAMGEAMTRPEAVKRVLLADPALHRQFIAESSGTPPMPEDDRPGPDWVRQWHKAVDASVAGGMTRQAATAHLARTEKKLHTRYLAAVNYGKMPDALWRRQYASVL